MPGPWSISKAKAPIWHWWGERSGGRPTRSLDHLQHTLARTDEVLRCWRVGVVVGGITKLAQLWEQASVGAVEEGGRYFSLVWRRRAILLR